MAYKRVKELGGDASVYGDKFFGGTHIIYVLEEKIDFYNALPAKPKVASSIIFWKDMLKFGRSGHIGSGLALLAFASFLNAGATGKTVPARIRTEHSGRNGRRRQSLAFREKFPLRRPAAFAGRQADRLRRTDLDTGSTGEAYSLIFFLTCVFRDSVGEHNSQLTSFCLISSG